MRSVLFLATAAALLLPAPPATAETAAEKSMAQQIGRRLKDSGQLRNYRIGVKYQDGVAWLTGDVSSSDQRATAVQLAEQMPGVNHVVCQLGCTAAGPAESDHSPKLFQAFNETQLTSAQSGPSPVVQAHTANNGMQMQRAPAMARANPQVARNQMGRGNMPLPSRRLPTGSAGPAIRQVSAQQNVYPASAPCAPGAMAPGSMGGGAMGGQGGQYGAAGGAGMGAVPVGFVHHGAGRGPSYENAQMPGYAWPSYASHPNYAALTYPKQYSPTAWPYIGPFYPYPQVPLAWRKVSLEWDDGWWFLDFSAHNSSH
jgi:hypothetical protein